MSTHRAPFNLIAQAKEQLAQAQQFQTDALISIGKADMTVHEPGDTACRAHIESALKNIALAERCIGRQRKAIERLLSMRPEKGQGVRLVGGTDTTAPRRIPITRPEHPDLPPSA